MNHYHNAEDWGLDESHPILDPIQKENIMTSMKVTGVKEWCGFVFAWHSVPTVVTAFKMWKASVPRHQTFFVQLT
jgi:hypothetical protein